MRCRSTNCHYNDDGYCRQPDYVSINQNGECDQRYNLKTAHDILCEKMDAEMTAFRKSYEKMSAIQIYNDWYIIGVKEEFYEMLKSGFIDNQEFEEELAWLAEMDAPIQYMYDYWMDCDDGAFNHNWEFLLDLVCDAYYEATQI